MEKDTSMRQNGWHSIGPIRVAKQFFADGREAGLAIEAEKDSIGQALKDGKNTWLNCTGMRMLVNIITGETKYTGGRHIEDRVSQSRVGPHRVGPPDPPPPPPGRKVG